MQNIEMEKRTLFVILLTLLTMCVEIVFGYTTKSMALLADGWHMGTHVLAFLLTYFSFVIIRKMSNSDCFAFGTGKISILSGYTSSLFLGLTAFMLMFESVSRLFNPDKINFDEAMIVVIVGLVVNILCLKIMGDNHEFHSHHKKHDSENVNYKSAYLHILADVLTSVLAIVALIFGKFFNFVFLDPIMGIVGGVIILKWAFELVKKTVGILLEKQDENLKSLIKEQIEGDGVSKIEDLRIFNVAENDYALILKIKAENCSVENYKARLKNVDVDLHFIRIELV